MVLAAICRNIHHILPDIASINLRKQLDTGVSYSKGGGGVIDVTCQSSIQIIWETSAVSLFTRLPTPTLLAAHGIATCFAFFPTDF